MSTPEGTITIAVGASRGLFRVLDRTFEARPVTPRETLPIEGLIDGTGMPTPLEQRATMRAILNARRLQEVDGKVLPANAEGGRGPEITDDWLLDIPGIDLFRLLAFLTNPDRRVLPKDPDALGGDLPN